MSMQLRSSFAITEEEQQIDVNCSRCMILTPRRSPRRTCAWLIRKYIDPKAQFVFIPRGSALPPKAESFDVPGVKLTHHGGTVHFMRCSRTQIGHSEPVGLRVTAREQVLRLPRFGFGSEKVLTVSSRPDNSSRIVVLWLFWGLTWFNRKVQFSLFIAQLVTTSFSVVTWRVQILLPVWQGEPRPE